MKKYIQPETKLIVIEAQAPLLNYSDIHGEESDGTSPMSLEEVDIWNLNE